MLTPVAGPSKFPGSMESVGVGSGFVFGFSDASPRIQHLTSPRLVAIFRCTISRQEFIRERFHHGGARTFGVSIHYSRVDGFSLYFELYR